MILALCDRFHCTPDAAVGLDASVLRLLRVEALGRRPEVDGGG